MIADDREQRQGGRAGTGIIIMNVGSKPNVQMFQGGLGPNKLTNGTWTIFKRRQMGAPFVTAIINTFKFVKKIGRAHV